MTAALMHFSLSAMALRFFFQTFSISASGWCLSGLEVLIPSRGGTSISAQLGVQALKSSFAKHGVVSQRVPNVNKLEKL